MASKPKAPPAPEDPAIAIEKARRKAVAMGMQDARRQTRFDQASTVLTSGAPGTELTRPTDPMLAQDPLTTTGGKREAEIDELQQRLDRVATKPAIMGGRGNLAAAATRRVLQKTVTQKRGQITPEEKAVFEGAKKDAAIAEYVNRTRSRIGVAATKR
jgi:hypothetical protein